MLTVADFTPMIAEPCVVGYPKRDPHPVSRHLPSTVNDRPADPKAVPTGWADVDVS